MTDVLRELTDAAPVGATITSGARQPVTIPASRYVDPSFAQLELERLWPRVWQLACAADHVATAGDAYEYRCGPYSVVIVRGDDGQLRAFQNVCRHRGTAICEGVASGLTELRCPFHRWSWDLAGKLREVPSRRGFGTLPAADYGLFPVAVESWGPFVFVDPSGTAGSLWDFLEGVPEDISWIALDEFRCDYLVTVPLPGNWKIISDGFSETYHVQGLHREMLPSVDDVNGPQRLWRHHGKLEQRYGLPSPRFREPPDTETTWRSFVEIMGARVGVTDPAAPTPPVPAGATLREVLAGMVRTVGEAAGVSYERFSDDQMMTMQQYNLFPNVSLVIFPDLLTVLRARPGPTPDAGFLDIINYHRAAPGAPFPRPTDVVLPEGQVPGLGLILDQDAGNVARAQRGLAQPGFTRMTLSREECRILNMHRNLEQWLGIVPSEIHGDEG
ncbi:MAG: aromatic ring-hydroxylating oxygenase subunit alpha [Acidimicrobiales bacterium]